MATPGNGDNLQTQIRACQFSGPARLHLVVGMGHATGNAAHQVDRAGAASCGACGRTTRGALAACLWRSGRSLSTPSLGICAPENQAPIFMILTAVCVCGPITTCRHAVHNEAPVHTGVSAAFSLCQADEAQLQAQRHRNITALPGRAG